MRARRAGVEGDLVVAMRVPRERLATLREFAAVNSDAQELPWGKVGWQLPGPARRAAARGRRRAGHELLRDPVGTDVDDRVDPDVGERLRMIDTAGDRRDVRRRVPGLGGGRDRVEEKDQPVSWARAASISPLNLLAGSPPAATAATHGKLKGSVAPPGRWCRATRRAPGRTATSRLARSRCRRRDKPRSRRRLAWLSLRCRS